MPHTHNQHDSEDTTLALDAIHAELEVSLSTSLSASLSTLLLSALLLAHHARDEVGLAATALAGGAQAGRSVTAAPFDARKLGREIARLRGPVGLYIGSKTPPEIVSRVTKW